MKLSSFIIAILVIAVCTSFEKDAPKQNQRTRTWFVEREADIRTTQPSPHNAPGVTTAYPYFSKVEGFKTIFRKRTLGKGSSIGYHYQARDEVYYIVSGKGMMKMNDSSFVVAAGDAILTRPGNSHGLEPIGNDSLTVIINYQEHK